LTLFIDSNVFLVAANKAARQHRIAQDALTAVFRTGEASINGQVIREIMVVLTRPKLVNGLGWTPTEAAQSIDAIVQNLRCLDETQSDRATLQMLIKRYAVAGKQVHDANIVATMLAHGVPRLLTFNAVDFERYGNEIEVVLP
jgi:predicted nucleic acid-binding protein